MKESDNPPLFWPEVESIGEFRGIWWVAHTKSRNEKALAQDLIRKDISYFLPMSWSVRRIRKRTVRSLLPLFKGYLFFCGDEDQRVELLRTNRVANVIIVKDQERLLVELMQIEKALRTGAALSPHKYIKEGQKCRVIGGPLTDLQGIVVRAPELKTESCEGMVSTKSTLRLVLQVDMLGRRRAWR